MKTLATLALAGALLFTATGCGEDVGPTIESTLFASTLDINLSASTKTASGLYYRDLVVGSGTTATATSSVAVRYTGWLSNGSQFDTNQSAGGLPVKLGIGQVIPGFDEGIVGMKVGGQRQLIIPPNLAYGEQGYQTIPGNAVLVFKIELISVQ